MRSLSVLTMGIVALAVSGAAGCSTYHYYDIDVQMATSGSGSFNLTTNEIGSIQRVVMTVSGADNGQIVMGPNANGVPISTAGHLGVVEFSTFKDSGTLTFTVDAYDSTVLNSNCKVGEGTVSLPASSNTTNTGMVTVNRASGATFCCSGNTC
ncbi:MAG TPA: hypothetical protein VKQ32_14710 [Polyangia bacterium]|nr:hypothetical protein [Polyangia bacterium]